MPPEISNYLSKLVSRVTADGGVFSSVSVIDHILLANARGRVFRRSYKIENLTGGSSQSFLVQNPEGSERYLELSPPKVSVGAEAETESWKNRTVSGTGTELELQSTKTDSTVQREGVLFVGPTTSGGDSYGTAMLQSGERGKVVETTEEEAVLIAPGDNVEVEIRNQSNNQANYSMTFAWNEVEAEVI